MQQVAFIISQKKLTKKDIVNLNNRGIRGKCVPPIILSLFFLLNTNHCRLS